MPITVIIKNIANTQVFAGKHQFKAETKTHTIYVRTAIERLSHCSFFMIACLFSSSVFFSDTGVPLLLIIFFLPCRFQTHTYTQTRADTHERIFSKGKLCRRRRESVDQEARRVKVGE